MGLALLLLSVQPLSALVFINTVPSGAEVIINNRKIGVTPLLFREDFKSAQTMTFRKAGYQDNSIRLLQKTPVTNLYALLTPDTFSLYFPDKTSVIINNQAYDNEEIRNIPSGYFYFRTDQNSIRMDRINPNRKYLVFSLIMTGIGLTTGIVAHYTGNNAYAAYTNNSDPSQVFSLLESAKFLDILSWTGYGLSIAGGGLSVYFGVDEMLYRRKNQTIQIKSQVQSQDTLLYNQALDFLSLGEAEKSKENFSQLISRYPDSKYVPVSLLRRSSLLQKQNKLGEAARDLETIKSSYPIFEIYEITVKSLGDIYRESGQYAAALTNFQEALLLRENYSASELELLILETRTDQVLTQGLDSSGLRQSIQIYIQSPEPDSSFKSRAQALLDKLP